MQLAFEARICPVSRLSASSVRSASYGRRAGETDCFLSACLAAGTAVRVDREQVYVRWLARELARGGAAKMLSLRMLAFRRTRLLRRNHGTGRKTVFCERPDALIAGTLEVADPSAFAALLRRGIGRHRAFGFGMLLLKARGMR
jgi:CRISPR system Cascade subunit CasE